MDEHEIYLTTIQVIAINTVQIPLYSPDESLGLKDPNLHDSAINRQNNQYLALILIQLFSKKQPHFLSQ
jgi:hypothetical protein